VTPTASSLDRLARAAFAVLVCAIALVSVALAVVQAAEVARPRGEAVVARAEVSTPRAADLVTARKTVTRESAPVAITNLDASYERMTALNSIIAGTAMTVEVNVTNTGLLSWPAGGEQAVHLSYHWFDAQGNTVMWDGARAVLQHDVAPGDMATLVVDLRAPATHGSYVLAWDMVKEGSGWFSASAAPMKTERLVVDQGVTTDDLRAVARQAAVSAGLDPVIFDRQIEAESGFDPQAQSPAGAVGIAQITPATARTWGVDPSDPVASLQAAAQQMAGYVDRYGNYAMALAAYNAGPRAVERFGGVPPYAETQNYVRKILSGAP